MWTDSICLDTLIIFTVLCIFNMYLTFCVFYVYDL